jgi:hypothetical protein
MTDADSTALALTVFVRLVLFGGTFLAVSYAVGRWLVLAVNRGIDRDLAPVGPAESDADWREWLTRDEQRERERRDGGAEPVAATADRPPAICSRSGPIPRRARRWGPQ